MFSRRNIKYLSTVAALLIVILVSLRLPSNPVKSLVLNISSPFLKFSRILSGGVSGFFDFLGSIGELKSENEKIIEENQNLLVQNNRLKDAEKENQALRDQLELAPRKDFNLEASFVIGQDPQGFGNYLLIDKGDNFGIKRGMTVVVSSGLLVGRVTETYGSAAKITLVTDPESAINAEAQDSGAKGIVKGEYGLGLRMGMISQAEVVNESETVITSGLGGEVPRGLTIGKIGQVSQSSNKLFQETSVIPAVDFSKLKVVYIIKP